MRFGFWLHMTGWLAVLVFFEGRGSAEATSAVPGHAPSPPAFAVTPFENHVVNGRALDWIVVEAPFELADKTQDVLGLAPTGGPLFLPSSPVPAEAEPVAAFARQRRAEFVITGWFDRIGEDLRIAVVVWRVDPTPHSRGSADDPGGAGVIDPTPHSRGSADNPGGAGVIDPTASARVVGEAKSQGPIATYHAILGNVAAEAWARAGVTIDDAKRQLLRRSLSPDVYPVFTMARGLGLFIAGDLKNAERDLERAVFLDPKLFAAHRLLGELYRRRGEPKDPARAVAKFNYALELAPNDIESLRGAAVSATAMGQWERGLELWTAVVMRRPWEVEARFQFGRAQWQLGNVTAAERQLTEVVSHQPDHLAARHVLALIHASRSDTKRLAAELELISLRAPRDLDVKSDLAAAYSALGRWDQAAIVLEALVGARPTDVAILVRSGDVQRKRGDIVAAIRWYERAARLMPETSMPGYLIAQAQFDGGNFAAANHTYTNLRKFGEDAAAAEHALGVIALAANRFDDAALQFRRAVKSEPRSLEARRALIAAELERKDPTAAWRQLEPALRHWPDDGILHYLAGLASRLSGDSARAHRELHRALDAKVPAARLALDAIDTGGAPRVHWRPELIRPWGDSEALGTELDRFAAIRRDMASVRLSFQTDFIAVLGLLGKGPAATRNAGRGCPARGIAQRWSTAQSHLSRYQRLGVDLEASFQRITRHHALGVTAGLLPTARAAAASVKRDYQFALEDVADLRAQWVRGLGPELVAAGCSAAALAAVGSDSPPVSPDDNAGAVPQLDRIRNPALPRSTQRVTFFLDNTDCPEPVDLYVDDHLIGRAASGQRSAWVADGGDRTLCVIVPGTAQCGDRGTARRAYLHDGWTLTMRCPK